MIRIYIIYYFLIGIEVSLSKECLHLDITLKKGDESRIDIRELIDPDIGN